MMWVLLVISNKVEGINIEQAIVRIKFLQSILILGI